MQSAAAQSNSTLSEILIRVPIPVIISRTDSPPECVLGYMGFRKESLTLDLADFIVDDKDYLQDVLGEFRRLKQTADGAVSQVPDNQLFEVLDPQSNSIAVLLKHMAGNLRSRCTDFLTTDGEKPNRDRDSEFVITARDTKADLLREWETCWSVLFATLESLDPSDLSRTVAIRSEPHSVVQAINRQLTHYGYHVGQLVFLSKHWAGERWQAVSIGKGKSKEFNLAPTPYKR